MDEAKIAATMARQAAADTARQAGDLAAEISELRAYGPGVVAERVATRVAMVPALASVADAMLTGDPWAVAARYGVAPIGEVDRPVTLDRRCHTVIGDEGPRMIIVRQGFTWRGEIMTRAEVAEAE